MNLLRFSTAQNGSGLKDRVEQVRKRFSFLGASAVWAVSWLYVLAVAFAWFLIRALGDRWWLGTVLMFGPRWIWGGPLLLLVPWAALCRRRSLWVLAAGAVLVLGPVMGLCVPWRSLLSWGSAAPRIRVLTCNVHGKEVDADRFVKLFQETKPDIVALQAYNRRPGPEFFREREWHVSGIGEFCVASRFPIRNPQALKTPGLFGDRGGTSKFDLETPQGLVHFFVLHLASPRDSLISVKSRYWGGAVAMAENTELRQRQMEAAIQTWIGKANGHFLICGDFNTPCDSAIYREYWSPYENAFSAAGWGWGNTHFTSHTAIRIDHVLAGPGWRCRSCWVGPNVGSAHRPVLADMDWLEIPK